MSGLPIQFPFVAGVDESIDPKTAAPGRLSRLVNAAWRKDGLLDKRDGTEGITKAGGPSSAKRLATRGDELLMTDGASLYSLRADGSAWVNVGQVPEVAIQTKPPISPIGGIQCADVARLSDGRIVHAWVSGDPTSSGSAGALYYEVFDPTTGARSVSPTQIASASARSVRIVTNGTTFVIIYSKTIGQVLASINGTGVFTSLTTAAAGVAGGAFDACDTGNGFCVAYELGTGGVQIRRFDYALALQADQFLTASNTMSGFTAISIDGRTTETLFIAFCWPFNGATARVEYASANADTLAIIDTPVDIDTTVTNFRYVGIARKTATTSVLEYFGESTAATFLNGCTVTGGLDAAGVMTGKRRANGYVPLTRPFVLNGTFYTFLGDLGAAGGAYGVANRSPFPGINSYLVSFPTSGTNRTTPPRLVGLVDLLISGKWYIGQLSNVLAVSSTEMLAALPSQQIAPVLSRTWDQGTRLVDIAIGASLDSNLFRSIPHDLWSSASFGGETHFAGAYYTAYDGRHTFNALFPQSFIDTGTFAASAVGGHMIGATSSPPGNYIYSHVPKFVSAAGITHRGPGSEPWTQTVAGTNVSSVTVAMMPQGLGWKGVNDGALAEPLPVLNIIYRSEVNGSDLHELTIAPTYNVSINDPTTQPNTFTDTKADDHADLDAPSTAITLASRPLIYNASELDDFPPIASLGMHSHRNRPMVIAADGRTVLIGKDFTEDPTVAPGFHPTQALVFDNPLVGIRTLGFNFIVFAEDTIFTIEGAGPSRNGEGSDYAPIRVPTDKGCVNPRSLVTMPLGIMYESPVGISLLDAGLQVSWIGSPIQDTLVDFPVITSATLDAVQNKVRFTCNAEDGASGVVLVFDYIRKQWSVFKYYDTDAAVASTPIADAIIWQNRWTFVTPGGKVYTEDDSTFLDDGSHWVEADIETTENFSSGPLGYQRVRRVGLLGARFTDCDLRIRIAVNGSASYDQDHTFTSDVVAAIGTANLTRVVKTQKNGSIRVRFTDATPTIAVGSSYVPVVGSGRGLNYSALGFEIEPIEGMNRRAARAVA